MAKGKRKSKRWFKARRNLPIWEKFEEQPEKRVTIFEFRLRKELLDYIQKFSNRKLITRSAVLETIIDRFFFYYFLEVDSNLNKKRLISDDLVKAPKFLIHPVYIELIDKEAKEKNYSRSLVIDYILQEYMKRYPIF